GARGLCGRTACAAARLGGAGRSAPRGARGLRVGRARRPARGRLRRAPRHPCTGSRLMRAALIGQKGIPATYGGIERPVDGIARRLVPRGVRVDVFCRLYYTPPGSEYHDIGLLRRPSIHTKHLDTATHVTWATLESMVRRYDVVHF